MRLIFTSLVAAMAVASPAMANEGRVEARGGVYWTPGFSKATAGIAAGYDWDLGSKAFAGVEVSGDKVLTAGTIVAFGFTARAGVKASEDDKLYITGGYTTKFCSLCTGGGHAGAGYEHSFGKIYGKVEYRHFFPTNGGFSANVAGVGVGYKF